jgi:hypothetical protein
MAPLKIGSQQYLLDFDTGTPDLWVFSSFMDTPPPGRHTIYDPSNSTAATATNETWGILSVFGFSSLSPTTSP